VLVLIFALTLHWFPSQGGYYVTTDTPGLNLTFFQDVVNHAFLPAVALLITTIGTWILTMRNTMITTLAEDYVRMARAKGLPGWRIMLDYAARNAILPNLTGFAMSLGFVVSGAILIEYVFNYPGVGYMLLQAVSGEDYPLMQALFLLITVAVLLAMWAAHFLLFRGAGLVAWVGMIIVVQNVVSSLFNSHLFDFSQGWLYVFGVGVAGGTALNKRGGAAI